MPDSCSAQAAFDSQQQNVHREPQEPDPDPEGLRVCIFHLDNFRRYCALTENFSKTRAREERMVFEASECGFARAAEHAQAHA